jgi:hypothetical protein
MVIWCRVSGEDQAGEVWGQVATGAEGPVGQGVAIGLSEW